MAKPFVSGQLLTVVVILLIRFEPGVVLPNLILGQADFGAFGLFVKKKRRNDILKLTVERMMTRSSVCQR